MKKVSLLLIAVNLIAATSFAQTIRRVSNMPGVAVGTNTYTTVDAAVTAADNDDIIYIEPSVTVYSFSNVIDKKLHFIGNGNFLINNPDTPYTKAESMVANMSFGDGSSGSTATGLFFQNTVGITDASGIQLRRNRSSISGGTIVLQGNTSDILIAENFIEGNIQASSENHSGLNCIVRNNIVRGSIFNFKSATISNNTTALYPGGNISCVLFNNIFENRNASSFPNLPGDNTSSNFTNNLFVAWVSATLPDPNPDGASNHYSNNPTGIFVNDNPWQYQDTPDGEFRLRSGSPALGIGTDGADAGVFGGVSPYKLSTLPGIPIITSAVTSGAGNENTPLNVTISVKSN